MKRGIVYCSSIKFKEGPVALVDKKGRPSHVVYMYYNSPIQITQDCAIVAVS